MDGISVFEEQSILQIPLVSSTLQTVVLGMLLTAIKTLLSYSSLQDFLQVTGFFK